MGSKCVLKVEVHINNKNEISRFKKIKNFGARFFLQLNKTFFASVSQDQRIISSEVFHKTTYTLTMIYQTNKFIAIQGNVM